jgi:hypothetical protein
MIQGDGTSGIILPIFVTKKNPIHEIVLLRYMVRYTTGATSGGETAYPSGAPELTILHDFRISLAQSTAKAKQMFT